MMGVNVPVLQRKDRTEAAENLRSVWAVLDDTVQLDQAS